MKKFLYISLALFVALLSACSETKDESTEFDNWQERNIQYFADVFAKAKAAETSGDKSWKLIRCYTKPETTTAPTDFIVVKVLNDSGVEGTTNRPLATDSTKVHYRGYLMPSSSYNTTVEGYPATVGYQFDSSWYGKYNLDTMLPAKMVPGQMVLGFTTTLLNMHVGDRWLVYMPSQLGYDSKKTDGIPTYSTLIFDVTLLDYWKARIK